MPAKIGGELSRGGGGTGGGGRGGGGGLPCGCKPFLCSPGEKSAGLRLGGGILRLKSPCCMCKHTVS